MNRAYSLASFASILLFGTNAFAHLELTSPTPRAAGQTEGDLKQGPCGQDPGMNARTDRVKEYTPGETIEVQFLEYVDHNSYYRIALDVDGDDSFTNSPNSPDPASVEPLSDLSQTLDSYILQYYLDDQVGMGMHSYSTMVTLPNIECENCTLQVVQYMFDRQMPYYHQCADIVIRGAVDGGAGGTGGSGAGGSTSSTGASMNGVGGAGTTATDTTTATSSDGIGTDMSTMSTGSNTVSTTGGAMTSMSSSSNTTTSTATATTGLTNPTGVGGNGGANPPVESEEEGCSCRAAPRGPGVGWWSALLGLGLVGARRRRARSFC